MRVGIRKAGLQELLVLYVIVWTISPILEVDMIYRLLALGSVGLWGIIAINKGFYVHQIHIYAVLFAIAVVIITYFEKGTLDAIMQHIPIYILVVCFGINCYYQNRWDRLQWILPIILILLVYFNWKTGNAVIEDPTIARKLVRADEETYMYLRQGIGGYSLIYPQVCIFPAIMMWIKRAFRRNNLYFIIGIVWLVTYVRCVWNAGYSLAIFTSIASIMILWGFRGRSAVNAVILSIAIFVIGLAAILYVDSFREFLLTQFDGTAVAKKIQDLVATSEEGVAEGSIYDRMIAYQASLEVIFEYPVIGSLWNRSGGGHSAFLDVLAKFGVWGAYVYGNMIFWVPSYYKKKYNHPTIYGVSNAMIVALLFLVMLDSFTYSFMAMIILVLPIIYEDIIKWEKIRE